MNMSLLVIAYPELSSGDLERIEEERKRSDSLYTVVDPHFTFVFAVPNIPEQDFIAEIKEKAAGFGKIDFCIRCATISKDTFSETYHTFLIPDEGYSRMVKLHDALYSGLLREQLRLDIDYIPHIRIGNSVDKFASKQLVDEWNANDFSIRGSISRLTIIRYENNIVTPRFFLSLSP